MKYSKPYQDIDTLIKTLKDRGLVIPDDNRAKVILRTYSYYDLVNGYKDILMPNDIFPKGVTIEYLRDFYMLDKQIQSLCMKYSLILETSLKYCISDILANKYGVHQDDYLDSRNFRSSFKRLEFEHVKIEVLKNSIPKKAHQPTKHYIEHHNHIPPWILFKNISLGASINLFKLLKQEDKSSVVKLMIPCKDLTISERINLLITSLDGIRLFRNAGAHNLNFVNSKFKYSLPLPALQKLLPDYLFNKANSKAKISNRESISGIYGVILCFLSLIQDKATKRSLAYEFKRSLFTPYDAYDNAIRQVLHGPYKTLARIPYDTEERLSTYISDYR